MDKDPSFLFAGITFDRRSFAKDFEKFKEKKKEEEVKEIVRSEEFEPEEKKEMNKKKRKMNTQYEPEEKKEKKRKRKTHLTESVVGFRVFKTTNSVDETKQISEAEDHFSLKKKEVNQQRERDANLRKSHSIHVSGSNIPSPLLNFDNLRTRYNCRPYLLRNFMELKYKEPTPIQRQAIPVLLSGQECFACAPTGSGKTMAFLCPMLMKLKHGLKDSIRAVVLCPTRELAA